MFFYCLLFEFDWKTWTFSTFLYRQAGNFQSNGSSQLTFGYGEAILTADDLKPLQALLLKLISPLVCLCLTWLAGALSHNALSPLTHQTVAVPVGRAPAQITTRQLIELFFSSQAGGHCKNIPTLEYGFLVQVPTWFKLYNRKSIQFFTHK